MIAGLLFIFTTVKMRGPNKSLNLKTLSDAEIPLYFCVKSNDLTLYSYDVIDKN